MPNVIQDGIARLIESKGAGEGPPQAFGQAGGLDPARGPADPGQAGQAPSLTNADEDMNLPPDPLSLYDLQQANLGTMSQFAGLSRTGNVGGISTSLPLALHGNRVREEAERYQNEINKLRLLAELRRAGIGIPGMPSGVERAIKEDQENERKKTNTKSPSGYNPTPDGKENPATATPPSVGSAGDSWATARF